VYCQAKRGSDANFVIRSVITLAAPIFSIKSGGKFPKMAMIPFTGVNSSDKDRNFHEIV
jgi:hypothetical protein